MAHTFDQAGTTSVQPEYARQPAAVAARLPHAPTAHFYLRYHPGRWQFVNGEWLPQLGTLKHDLGVGGVDKSGNMDHALIDSQKRGWTVIPMETTPDGNPYVVRYPCNGGFYHCTRWERPREMSGRVLPADVDTDGYHAWLRWLVAEGKVAPPSADILELIEVEKQRQRVNNLAKESHKPGLKPVYDAEAERLAAMADSVAGLREKPKRGRGA